MQQTCCGASKSTCKDSEYIAKFRSLYLSKFKTVNATTRAYIELHIAVFLFGFTAILGDLIQLPALSLVWWRVLFTSLSLLFFVNISHIFRQLPRRLLLQFMGIGVLIAIHWLSFYGAIKLANASIALICMATTSFFTALLEPLLMRQRVKWFEVGLGMLIVPGMILVVNGTDFSMFLGIGVGLAAAFLASVFGILNKKLIETTDTFSITFLELSSAWMFLSILLPFFVFNKAAVQFIPPTWQDWGYILTLAFLCTTLAYVLSLRALRHISAFAANLTVNLEPVYGILLAWVILKEQDELSVNFYWGGLIILLAVFSYPVVKWYRQKQYKSNFYGE